MQYPFVLPKRPFATNLPTCYNMIHITTPHVLRLYLTLYSHILSHTVPHLLNRSPSPLPAPPPAFRTSQ